MTIEKIDGGSVSCVWYERDGLAVSKHLPKRGHFDANELVAYLRVPSLR